MYWNKERILNNLKLEDENLFGIYHRPPFFLNSINNINIYK